MKQPFIACYLRKSVVESEDTASPARQRAAIERAVPPQYARRWYQDLDLSGRYEASRPDFMRLLTDLRDPDCAGVACESLDRIYRNRTEFGQFKARLDASGQQLIIANMMGVDGTTAAGHLFLGITSEIGEFESRIASERMAGHIRHLRMDQGRHWGNCPFGTSRDEKMQLAPSNLSYYYNPLTGAVQLEPAPGWEERFYYDGLKELYTLYAAGDKSFYDVCVNLHDHGWFFWSQDNKHYPRPFNRETVRSIIRRWELYAGQLPIPDKGVFEGGHNPILPTELCRRVGDVLKNRHQVRNGGKTASAGYTYLLTGVAFCAECGARLGGQRSDRGALYYYRHMYNRGSCKQKMVPAPKIETDVKELMQPVMDSQAVKRQRVQTLQTLFRLERETLSDVWPQLSQAESEMGRLIDLRVSGLITKEQFEIRQCALQEKIKNLQERVPTVELSPHFIEYLMTESIPFTKYDDPLLVRNIVHGLFARIDIAECRIHNFIPQEWASELFQMMTTGDSSSVEHLVVTKNPLSDITARFFLKAVLPNMEQMAFVVST